MRVGDRKFSWLDRMGYALLFAVLLYIIWFVDTTLWWRGDY